MQTSIQSRVDSLYTTMLGEIRRLKQENAALLTTLSRRERQIATLQEQVHCMQQVDDGVTTWIEDEQEYVAFMQNVLTSIQQTNPDPYTATAPIAPRV